MGKRSINNFFEQVYLINLDRRKDRLDQFNVIAEKNNISYTRFAAIDGSKLDTKPGEPPHPGWSTISVGNYGNVISQRSVIQDAISNNYSSILILEDDVEFSSESDINSFLDNVPSNWDMLYFGGNHQGKLSPIDDQIGRCTFTLTAHSVGIKNTMYEDILYQTSYFNVPIDLSYAMMHKNYTVYSPLKSISWQSAGYSDIEEKVVDYSTILK